MYSIAVIGAGASGIAAAIAAKRENPKLTVALIEALPRIGKKILATGNGRCNLTNLNASPEYYNSTFTKNILSEFTSQAVIDFFASIGLRCVCDSEGRVYPMSNTASSVLDCLRFETERLGIDVITDTRAETIENRNGIFIINGSFQAQKLILALGGKASPSQGSDGSGYKLLKTLGHSITPVFPALVQLCVKENIKALKGVRVKADVKLVLNKNIIDSSRGEVLFTDYGLSGIAVMDVSRNVKDGKYSCILDILPSLEKSETVNFLAERKKQNPHLSADNTLSGILPKKAGQYVLRVCGIKENTELGNLSSAQLGIVAGCIKNLCFEITGTNGFNNAQITSGGAQLKEFDSSTLESKKIKNLYCTGELLDVDSVCGGFNLHWAWASGLTAGRNASNQAK